MTTKKKLAEQVLLKLSGGIPTTDSQIDIREIMADIDQLRDNYIRIGFLSGVKEGNYFIDQYLISEYDVSVSDEKFRLPARPISLPRNYGIQGVYDNIEQKQYIIIDASQVNSYRGKKSFSKLNQNFVYFSNGYGYLLRNVSNWFLPSLDELNMMRTNLYENGNIGGFDELGSYWTSTEYSATLAYAITMWSGAQIYPAKSNTNQLVRACRTFEAKNGIYAIGDNGPSGGYIFYIDGTKHYEAGISDISDGMAWSNITSVLVDSPFSYNGTYYTIGSDIGDGIINTHGIINQTGHSESAAYTCSNETTIKILMVASSESITESDEYPITPEMESDILNAVIQKYEIKLKIPHDERMDGQK